MSRAMQKALAKAREEKRLKEAADRQNEAIDRQHFILNDPSYQQACADLDQARAVLKEAEAAEWRARENLTQARAMASGRWDAQQAKKKGILP